MTVEHLELEPREPQRAGHGRVFVAGALGACALGVGLGLWARPSLPNDSRSAPPDPPAAEAPRAALQIVIDDAPAPVGELLEVLPPDMRHHNLAPFGPRPEQVAARRPASGLVKVDAPVAVKPLPVVRLVTPEKVKAEPPRATQAARRAEQPARAAKTEAKPAKQAQRAEAKPVREKTRLAKARIETVEKKVVAAAKPQAKKLAKAAKAAPKAIEARAKKAVHKARKTEVAKAGAKPKEVVAEKAKLAKAKPAPVKAKSKEAVRVQAKKKPEPRGEGPMRVAQAPPSRCANADPGEAMVCADGRLGVRDRQLQQAYRNAEAAGVPASALRRQQARWLQARAAAAREAPWAVEDVYVARIAELNDLTQYAREN